MMDSSHSVTADLLVLDRPLDWPTDRQTSLTYGMTDLQIDWLKIECPTEPIPTLTHSFTDQLTDWPTVELSVPPCLRRLKHQMHDISLNGSVLPVSMALQPNLIITNVALVIRPLTHSSSYRRKRKNNCQHAYTSPELRPISCLPWCLRSVGRSQLWTRTSSHEQGKNLWSLQSLVFNVAGYMKTFRQDSPLPHGNFNIYFHKNSRALPLHEHTWFVCTHTRIPVCVFHKSNKVLVTENCT
jgi:hypothetical protein